MSAKAINNYLVPEEAPTNVYFLTTYDNDLLARKDLLGDYGR